MRYQALATDYDGTIAHNGIVSESTVAALSNLLATGRRLILVTGRELPELLAIFPEVDLCEWVVAENGGLLYHPATKEERPLAEAPSPAFLEMLQAREVERVSVGRVIVATWEPYENIVLESIRDLGLESQVIFNKGAVMILPAGVNKASGLTAALKEMGLSPHNVVGVGDAENDHAMLKLCEFSAAVSNALPAVKETADFVTPSDHGDGVAQLIAAMVEDDLAKFDERLARHHLVLGKAGDDEIAIPSHGPCILICGPSASGKSTLVTRIVETLEEQHYQFCLFDPEGDYENFAGAVAFGSPDAPPAADEALQLLSNPDANAIVNLTGLKIPDRPPMFLSMLGPLLQMRTRTGRPHWLILDEAHHLLPADWRPPDGVVPEEFQNVIMITVHPELLAPEMLQRVDMLLVVGENAEEMIATYCETAGIDAPDFAPPHLQQGEVLLWKPGTQEPPLKIAAYPCKTERRRHRRKYAEGELPPDRSFFFRGPDAKLNLRAQNLMMFLQVADGVDDDTWEFHRQQGDYSKWFETCVKDEGLTVAAKQIESLDALDPHEGREMLRAAIEREYILAPTSKMPVAGAS
ncbi:HAD-IIB family hydrolase [Lacipirellula sp.]|uniref:HAD-IIB family hydrolase n=1 Tax=Lacipirellula sp. TaxID=2691419 RepID=UPI003D0F746A